MNTAGAQTLDPVLFKVGYDPVRSFEPIAHLATIPLVMIVNPQLPVRTLQEYVALARGKSAPMSYASGTAMIELVTEAFKTSARIPDVQAVGCKGTGPALPEVPTMLELGCRDMVFFSWAGLLAPAGTPKEIVARLANELSRIMAMPAVRERMLSFDFEPVKGTPAQFRQMMTDEVARWNAIVKATNCKAQP